MAERDTKIEDEQQDPHPTSDRLAKAIAAHDKEKNESTTHELSEAYREDIAERSGVTPQARTS
jgi:hypothetical protein